MIDDNSARVPSDPPTQPRWPRWLRPALVLSISLVAHVLVLWLVSGRLTRERPPRRVHPINLVIRERPATETPRIEVTPHEPPRESTTPPEIVTRPPEAPHRSGRSSGILEFPDLAPTREPALGQRNSQTSIGDGHTPQAGSTGAPAKPVDTEPVDLFRGEAVGRTAHSFSTPLETTEGPNLPQRGELSAGEQVASALEGMRTQQSAEQHVEAPREVPPALAGAQREADRVFDPPPTAVAASRKKCSACQHEVGRLSAIVDVSKSDGDGQTTFILSQPSGDSAFDQSALMAVKAALPGLPAALAWSRWRFSAEVYRWSASDMLLDPSFKPPGKRLPSSGLGAMSMTTSVKLVAFR